MAFPKPDGERPMRAATRPPRKKWSLWPYLFGVALVAYGAAFVSVIAIGAGYAKRDGTPTPMTAALVNVTVFAPTPTRSPAPPTATPLPATRTVPPPTAPPDTPTPDPNVDFRVPLSASNTGTFGGQRVAILNITTDAQPTTTARPVAGYKFVTIEVRVENLSDAPVTLGTWQIHTTPGVDFATITGVGDPLATGGTVAPRATIQGMLVFSVPTTARITWLKYAPIPTARGALYFDAT
ncbi:MAG: DUF4352 domain-containing protein [Thermomicrobiales bacterium]